MRQFIFDYFGANVGALTLQEIVLNFIVASILSVVLFISYRLTHTGTLYSARFNVTLVMIAIVTTMVMNVIGNNIALSLGMVGALSIIRFRTAIKDARDATYIFWAIGIGICCGVSEYLISSIGSAFLFVIMLAFGAVKNNNRFLFIIRTRTGTAAIEDSSDKKDIEQIVRSTMDKIFNYKARLCVENKDDKSIEFIYEISRHELDKAEKTGDETTVERIKKIEGVTSVSLVEQNDEVNQ